MPQSLMYHLVPDADFSAPDMSADYTPRAFERDGFIHCTNDRDEMARVANRFYKADPRPHLYLCIDKQRVNAPIRYEDGDPTKEYPHIYGPLNRDAIIAVAPAGRDAQGNFLPPENLTVDN